MTTSPIPAEMRDRDQWITWQQVKDQKIPNGRSNTPSDWKTYAEVEIFDNIAFVFSASDPLCGIDLDGCVQDGQYTPWVLPILERFKGIAYGEISPSGTGLKLTTLAKKPAGSRCLHVIGADKQQIECYDDRRFWTITANVVDGLETIGNGQTAIDWLCATYLSKTEQPKEAPQRPSSQRLIDRAKAYAEKVPSVGVGSRNQSAFRLAGHLAAIDEDGGRLSESEVLEIVRSWNDRNAEPLGDDDEVCKAVHSAMTNGTAREPKTSSSPKQQFETIKPVSIGDLIDRNPDMRPVVIEGILRRGETANIIAAAKVGKSFLAGNLAWCIATGMPWLGHDVTQGRVLIIDNELHLETLASRLRRIADEMMIDFRDFSSSIDIISLRGQNIDIHGIQSRLAEILPGTYALALVDALYRTLPSGTSENDNAAMMAIYNRLDFYASQWDCAIAVVHHASKGQQGDKSVTDVGSGAGSISRAADTHIVIRPHEDPELSVLDCVTRSFKSPDPVSIRFDWPLWQMVETTPEVKRIGQRREEKQTKDDAEADALLGEAFSANNKALSASQLERSTGMGPARVNRAIGRALRDGAVECKRVNRNGRKVDIFRPTATASATAKK